jgi:hypothetical protein
MLARSNGLHAGKHHRIGWMVIREAAVLSFIYSPKKRTRDDRSTSDLEREKRVSMKRLRMIDVQAKEIERLTVMNASLAAFVLDHRDCLHIQDPEIVLKMLIGKNQSQQPQASTTPSSSTKPSL